MTLDIFIKLLFLDLIICNSFKSRILKINKTYTFSSEKNLIIFESKFNEMIIEEKGNVQILDSKNISLSNKSFMIKSNYFDSFSIRNSSLSMKVLFFYKMFIYDK